MRRVRNTEPLLLRTLANPRGLRVAPGTHVELLLTPGLDRDFFCQINQLGQFFADPAVIVIVAAVPVLAATASGLMPRITRPYYFDRKLRSRALKILTGVKFHSSAKLLV